MRLSNFPLSTLKELPADAEVVSHQLMLRAGLIRKLAAGIYSWLPLGLRVLRKVERVVREEMDGSGALELLMPSIQPAELWQESERWGQYGPELLRITDRHQREFCYGPTHEEVITDIARRELQSYRQLPVNFYQIQTKFRDEIRPRFGVMRAREFMMKDAYSFHMNQGSLEATYQVMHHTYSNIFSRLGLDYRAVQADTGSIGGTGSHEFHVLADSGEDAIAFSDSGKYAANVELAEALPPTGDRPAPSQEMTKVATPGRHSIEEVASYLNTVPESCLKTLIVVGEAETLVALVLRGDHELNAIKAVKLPEVADPLVLAEADQVKSELGCEIGSLGPVGLSITTYIDRAAYLCHDFVCGANENDFHLTGVNWERDLPQQEPVDIRNVATGDPSPDGDGRLEIRRGVEVGHIFQLGTKYSAALDVTVLDEAGKTVTPTMGCYGIGVSRVVAAAIEQNHDTQGIIWPQEMAPFQIAIVPIKYHKSERLRTEVDRIYRQLIDLGYEVLLDDRGVRPGVSFADLELIGIPHRLVVGERGLDRGVLEYKSRRDGSEHEIQIAELTKSLATLIRA